MEKVKSGSTAADGFEYEDEEKKMDKFYELIRRYNEARGLHHHQSRSFITTIHRSKGVGSDTHAFETRMPSFKWEDFRDQHQDPQTVVVSDESASILQRRQPVDCIMDHAHRTTTYYDLNLKKRKTVHDDDDDEINNAKGLDLNLAL